MTNEERLQYLTEARSARHRIMTGGAVVEVVHEGQRIKYSEANLKDLEAYIISLSGTTALPTRGHFGVIF